MYAGYQLKMTVDHLKFNVCLGTITVSGPIQMEPQYDGTDSMQRVNEIPANVFSDDIG